ncbi:hypothetical protein [Streptomyces odontomachi]|uniref:hypothetical protein n=1 Tax=Streptomyces odontomachi TaxID=2944940 RepID=UPI00210BC150|nr:hypothetical protein [Streptomyces sp. ODS25]
MGFGTYVRRVRDEGLSAAQRHRALRHAVGQYCPLGFHATYAYLEATADPSPDFWRDPAALVRAVDALERSRSVWLVERAAFVAVRRAEKAAGRRSPRHADSARVHEPRWPGTEPPARLGLLAAVAQHHILLRSHRTPDETLVGASLDETLVGASRDDTLAGDGRLRRLDDLRARLDACACAYLTDRGHLDHSTRIALAGTVRGISRLVRPGYAPLNAYLFPWLRFGHLLAYASEVDAGD